MIKKHFHCNMNHKIANFPYYKHYPYTKNFSKKGIYLKFNDNNTKQVCFNMETKIKYYTACFIKLLTNGG